METLGQQPEYLAPQEPRSRAPVTPPQSLPPHPQLSPRESLLQAAAQARYLG